MDSLILLVIKVVKNSHARGYEVKTEERKTTRKEND